MLLLSFTPPAPGSFTTSWDGADATVEKTDYAAAVDVAALPHRARRAGACGWRRFGGDAVPTPAVLMAS
ncbi:hypothetical protein [Streptomyces sp. CBMA123]|uniref:hypothetical protein n=1 Tax=Streptomyces sp. CBMA123 TaxID=1896313 RepID=UPI001661E997|nr:hypothetical protein [Streptomyces sp. CBMA123]MBD0694795.1 hypothetical protein [Streptomyces sp. CBMA123]